MITMTNKTLLTLLTPLAATGMSAQKSEVPNVIFILADDIGYTDLGCYGAEKISTPHIDALAESGVKFTNAYAPASTSSPSRFALLTGKYAWRDKVGIMSGDAPLSIDTTQITLPKLFKQNGYQTAIIGKWHLGIGGENAKVDFNKRVDAGPESVGFDYSFYYPATNDRVPCVFIENSHVFNFDINDPISVSYERPFNGGYTGSKHPEKLKLNYHIGHDGSIIDSISRIGWMQGGESALWKDAEMGDMLFAKLENYILGSTQDDPFFIYYAPHNAHEPRVASLKFRGKSQAGIYGDVIEEFDDYVGRLVAVLKQKGIYDNTIIIISSDNGPMIKEGYDDGALENLNGHKPYGVLRGEKYSLHEGGTRIPFIYSWPMVVKQGAIQAEPFSYLDMLATFNGLLSFNLGDTNSTVDAKDGSLLFKDTDVKEPYRDFILTQNNAGDIALRKGAWKFIPSVRGYGDQLYNLEDDPSELRNLVYAHLDVVRDFKQHLSGINPIK